jgi:4-alpha-glucanotransferase
MNRPGRESGNWTFRVSREELGPEPVRRLRELVDLYQRWNVGPRGRLI